ncbi:MULTISPECIES: mechanosensitive ion channel family protein [Cyanophyceae]|uniref:mechanosensitive ion channel family protein n=1 Tax=Cyanophyceae TaxID=3028117 RepID=UPI0016854314|nr:MULTISPECIES: mechanosensitive ion channel family protein [Cyanophyceae]MBD1917002.1 mechanosensitive ion channel family protein [Phormidium sp. FACHB-77]MBD2029853.1 mechanosensitive ion channel family protein [Phormidium sp. FACHB-322]MBD2050359.1 mechanosensitive ion channel family protein [Leptolyngbya sp. FACHB-60]
MPRPTPKPTTRFRRPQRWMQLLLALLGLLLTLSWDLSPAVAQISNPFAGDSTLPPAGVERIGLLETTAIALDGTPLFDIASPAVFNRNESGTEVPVEVRARQIETNLNQVVNRTLALRYDDNAVDGASLDVTIETISGQPVLFAIGAGLAEPRVLLTITDTDAQYNGASQLDLADRWQAVLRDSLRQAVDSRLPEARQRQIRRTVWVLLASLLLTLVLTGIWRVLGWRKSELEQKQTAQNHLPIRPGADVPEQQLLQVFSYQLTLAQRIQAVAFFRWLVFWGIAFVWITGIASGLYIFPQTRSYAFRLFSIPVLLLLTWFFTGLLNRITNLAIERVAQAWSKNELGDLDDIQRKSMRISTIIGALKGLKTAVIYALATLLVLQTLRIAPASLLAFGAISALAISFAAQNLVKDLVNGFLILLEDQYAIGDLVTTGTTTGIVENLNLRITQIRGEDGRLVTLPNSLIAQVENLSRGWSRANILIDVAYSTNVDEALWVLHETAQIMASDPEWRYAILNPVEMLGVESMTHAGLTLLIWIRTRPLKQFLVAREFRRRLRIAFDKANIAIGVPQQGFTELPNSIDHDNHEHHNHNGDAAHRTAKSGAIEPR